MLNAVLPRTLVNGVSIQAFGGPVIPKEIPWGEVGGGWPDFTHESLKPGQGEVTAAQYTLLQGTKPATVYGEDRAAIPRSSYQKPWILDWRGAGEVRLRVVGGNPGALTEIPMPDSPSFDGRAPVPPEWVNSVAKTVAGLPGMAADGALRIGRSQRQVEPSAGASPGTALWMQPSTRSATMCPQVWRMATGAGGWAFRMQSSGATMMKGAREAALLGTSGPIRQRIAKTA